jgi:hypothetical protein
MRWVKPVVPLGYLVAFGALFGLQILKAFLRRSVNTTVFQSGFFNPLQFKITTRESSYYDHF